MKRIIAVCSLILLIANVNAFSQNATQITIPTKVFDKLASDALERDKLLIERDDLLVKNLILLQENSNLAKATASFQNEASELRVGLENSATTIANLTKDIESRDQKIRKLKTGRGILRTLVVTLSTALAIVL